MERKCSIYVCAGVVTIGWFVMTNTTQHAMKVSLNKIEN